MRTQPQLLDQLSRRRLVPRRAGASAGVGERRSKQKGAGMEFTDHRPYQPGDDLRHLDPHLYARLGSGFVREYQVHRQLPVAILIDASASMMLADGLRYRFAQDLARCLGFVALAAGDQLRLGIASNGAIEWSNLFTTPTQAERSFDWIDQPRTVGGSFDGCLAAAARELPGTGLAILIGDFWELPQRAGSLLRGIAEEIWAIQVLTAEEEDPELLGTGDTRLVDPETGEEVDIALEAEVFERFRRGLAAWQAELRVTVEQAGGSFLPVRVGTPLADLLLRNWRALGLLV